MDDKVNLFIKINKIDEEKREVAGYASTEDLDNQGEIVEKEAIKKALPDYLGDYLEEEGKWRYGNIREMHQMSAVGKTINAKVDNKGLFIVGKIVDDNAWKKVKERVYAGFSIGGKILKKIGNRIKALKLTEISLVDRPANPACVFTMVKFDKAGVARDIQKIEKHMHVETPPLPVEESDESFKEIVDANLILNMANDLRMLVLTYHNEGRKTTELKRALRVMKQLAISILQGENRKKYNKIFEDVEFLKVAIEEDIEPPTIPYEEVLCAGYILDLARDIRMLLDRFQAEGRPTIELERALTALKKLAVKVLSEEDKKKFDRILYAIDFSESWNKVAISPTIKESNDSFNKQLAKYIDFNWVQGYFDNMRKVVG